MMKLFYANFLLVLLYMVNILHQGLIDRIDMNKNIVTRKFLIQIIYEWINVNYSIVFS